MEEDSVTENDFDYDNSDNEYIATEQEIRDCKVDIISGEKENSLWLILDNKYILIKNRPFKDGKAVWECRGRRHHDCPFRMEVIVEDNISITNSDIMEMLSTVKNRYSSDTVTGISVRQFITKCNLYWCNCL